MTVRGKHGWALLAAALVTGGCGSSGDDEPSQPASTVPAATTATTPSRTSTITTPTPTRTSTTPRPTAGNGKRTATTTTRATTDPPAKPTPAKLGKPQTFRGDGPRVIGPLTLKRNAVVAWTVTGGGTFTVRDADGKLKISGSGKSGQSFAASGDYRSVKVTARGRWTLSFASLGA